MPLAGNQSLAVAALSYEGQLNLGVLSDPVACPDVEVFCAGVLANFQSLLVRTESEPHLQLEVGPAGGYRPRGELVVTRNVMGLSGGPVVRRRPIQQQTGQGSPAEPWGMAASQDQGHHVWRPSFLHIHQPSDHTSSISTTSKAESHSGKAESMTPHSGSPGVGGGHPGDLARRVSHRRIELGMTIEELAKHAGVDPTYLSYFERNADARLSAGTLNLLALALNTTPLDLKVESSIALWGREGPATIRLSRPSRGSSVRLISERAEWDESCSPWGGDRSLSL